MKVQIRVEKDSSVAIDEHNVGAVFRQLKKALKVLRQRPTIKVMNRVKNANGNCIKDIGMIYLQSDLV